MIMLLMLIEIEPILFKFSSLKSADKTDVLFEIV